MAQSTKPYVHMAVSGEVRLLLAQSPCICATTDPAVMRREHQVQLKT